MRNQERHEAYRSFATIFIPSNRTPVILLLMYCRTGAPLGVGSVGRAGAAVLELAAGAGDGAACAAGADGVGWVWLLEVIVDAEVEAGSVVAGAGAGDGEGAAAAGVVVDGADCEGCCCRW
jgi:hypothetical protein